jgi:HD-GYP domain-containing protein (c-di-GMP phosphodiesterase class II)
MLRKPFQPTEPVFPDLVDWRRPESPGDIPGAPLRDRGEAASVGGRMRLSEVIGALSYALDLTEGQPPGHSLRCAWIGMRIGQALMLTSDQLSDLYYTLLLKDAGCSSNAARLWELYGGDERIIKHNYKTVDSQSLLALGRFVLQHTGPGEPLRRRVQRLFNVARHGEELAEELIQTRCERGANIVRQLGFRSSVADGVYALDEHWNGKGRPANLQNEAIPLNARIALLAQVADVFNAVSGPIAARAEVRRRAGTWFDPKVVDAFLTASLNDAFWAGLSDDGLDARVAAIEPVAHAVVIDEDKLDVIAEAFADIIDAKSTFTSGHSRRVTLYADAIATNLGLTDARRRWLRRASLLHDIGKLGVSTGVLDKPGKLDAAEWEAMKRHAALSEDILSRMSAFRDLAAIAGAHHERLDGKGYPKGLAGAAIAMETRIITAGDIFDAITAKRPYRDPMSVPQAMATMERERGTALDERCLDALQAALPRLGLAPWT